MAVATIDLDSGINLNSDMVIPYLIWYVVDLVCSRKDFRLLSYSKAYFRDSDREITVRLQYCHLESF